MWQAIWKEFSITLPIVRLKLQNLKDKKGFSFPGWFLLFRFMAIRSECNINLIALNLKHCALQTSTLGDISIHSENFILFTTKETEVLQICMTTNRRPLNQDRSTETRFVCDVFQNSTNLTSFLNRHQKVRQLLLRLWSCCQKWKHTKIQ